jgi:predicted nucleic acid-binding protein
LAREKIRAYVLDASVAVKWFVDEQGSEKATQLREMYVDGKVDFAAPDLLKYEVANALRSHPIAQIDRATLTKALEALDSYQFLTVPPKEAWNVAVELTYTSGISLYDGLYVGLSLALRNPLVTADEKLINALSPDHKKHSVLLNTMEFPDSITGS